MAKNKLDMTKVLARWKKAKEQLPKLLTNVSKNTFVDSWKKQGWDDEKWKEVKRRTSGKGHIVTGKQIGRAHV